MIVPLLYVDWLLILDTHGPRTENCVQEPQLLHQKVQLKSSLTVLVISTYLPRVDKNW